MCTHMSAASSRRQHQTGREQEALLPAALARYEDQLARYCADKAVIFLISDPRQKNTLGPTQHLGQLLGYALQQCLGIFFANFDRA